MFLLTATLMQGLLWSALWMLMVHLSVTRFPQTILHDYPKDVQEAACIPAADKAQKKKNILFGLISFTVLILTALACVLWTYGWKETPFLTLFAHYWLMGMVWNAVDLLFVDWLLICWLTSPLFIFQGTEHCQGNKDYLFHLKGFFKGCLAMSFFALLLAGATALILTLS